MTMMTMLMLTFDPVCHINFLIPNEKLKVKKSISRTYAKSSIGQTVPNEIGLIFYLFYLSFHGMSCFMVRNVYWTP